MPRITCPKCQTSANLPDDYRHPQVQCPKCKSVFQLEELLPETEGMLVIDEDDVPEEFDFGTLDDPARNVPTRKPSFDIGEPVKRIRVEPRDPRYRNSVWTMELGSRGICLLNDNNSVLTEFHRGEADSRFRFPSFWASIKHFGIQLENGQFEDCYLSETGMLIVEEYLHGREAVSDPAAIRSYLAWGMLKIVGGIALMIIGVYISMMSHDIAVRNQEGRYKIWYGIPLIGFALVINGFMSFGNYFKLQKLVKNRSHKQAKDTPG